MVFKQLKDGDEAIASEIMNNFRHLNYSSDLLPVDSLGNGVDNTISIGSATFYFKDLYIRGKVQLSDISFSNADELRRGSTLFGPIRVSFGIYKGLGYILTDANESIYNLKAGFNSSFDVDSIAYHFSDSGTFSDHSFILVLKDGNVYVYGDNSSGKLGIGTTSRVTSETKVGTLSNIVQSKVYSNYSYFLDNTGKIFSSGSGNAGRLGVGSTTNSTTPVQITSKTDFKSLEDSSGLYCGYAIDNADELYHWGDNERYQGGTGSTTDSLSPTKVNLTSKTIKKFYSLFHSTSTSISVFAILNDNKLYAWGRNADSSQNYTNFLGNGSNNYRTSPALMTYFSEDILHLYGNVFANKPELYCLKTNYDLTFVKSGSSGNTISTYSSPATSDITSAGNFKAIYQNNVFFEKGWFTYGLSETKYYSYPDQAIFSSLRLDGYACLNNGLLVRSTGYIGSGA